MRQLADARQQMKNLSDSHWVTAQQNEPAIKLTYKWLKRPKNDHRTLAEFLQGRVPQQEQRLYAAPQKDFVEKRGMVYLKTTPSRSQEEVLVFVVPTHKEKSCHRRLPSFRRTPGPGPHSQLDQRTILVARHDTGCNEQCKELCQVCAVRGTGTEAQPPSHHLHRADGLGAY